MCRGVEVRGSERSLESRNWERRRGIVSGFHYLPCLLSHFTPPTYRSWWGSEEGKVTWLLSCRPCWLSSLSFLLALTAEPASIMAAQHRFRKNSSQCCSQLTRSAFLFLLSYLSIIQAQRGCRNLVTYLDAIWSFQLSNFANASQYKIIISVWALDHDSLVEQARWVRIWFKYCYLFGRDDYDRNKKAHYVSGTGSNNREWRKELQALL